MTNQSNGKKHNSLTVVFIPPDLSKIDDRVDLLDSLDGRLLDEEIAKAIETYEELVALLLTEEAVTEHMVGVINFRGEPRQLKPVDPNRDPRLQFGEGLVVNALRWLYASHRAIAAGDAKRAVMAWSVFVGLDDDVTHFLASGKFLSEVTRKAQHGRLAASNTRKSRLSNEQWLIVRRFIESQIAAGRDGIGEVCKLVASLLHTGTFAGLPGVRVELKPKTLRNRYNEDGVSRP